MELEPQLVDEVPNNQTPTYFIDDCGNDDVYIGRHLE